MELIGKQVQAKGWFLTYPKCEVSPAAALEYLKALCDVTEYVIAQEAHMDGTPHLHAFVKTDKKLTWSATRFDLPGHHGHYEPARSWAAVKKYVTKGGNYISSIDTDSAQRKRGKRNMELVSMTPREAVLQGYIPLMALPRFVVAQNMFKALDDPYEHHAVRGVWFYGPSGAGKSKLARDTYPGAYLKAQNKWWDGYAGQETVILDDFDRSGVCLGHYLKIWADRYSCTGETKGGQVALRHHRFVVTSNYPIETLWPDDQEMSAAIARRFKVTVFR